MMSYMQLHRLLKDTFELNAAKNVSYSRTDGEKEVLSCVATKATKATKPLATMEGNIIRVLLT